MIGYDELALMKSTAFFINTSRGGTYKEGDLARALAERMIAGAGVDVFLEEPPSTNHPLMGFDNVILTPHNAGSTREAHENVAGYASDQWIDIFDGKVPPRLINKVAWPKYSERFQRILGFKPELLRDD
jgi:D-3-phosphoglycerate dehydrogenase / 2-oxoglutarate reductase